MAVPFLSTLSKTARSVWPIVQGSVAVGSSARALHTIFRQQGIRISLSTVQRMFEAARDVAGSGAYIRAVNKSRNIDPDRLTPAATTMRRSYAFTVDVSGNALDTGERMTRSVTVSTDALLTPGEIEEQALEAIESDADRYGFEPEAVRITGGLRRV